MIGRIEREFSNEIVRIMIINGIYSSLHEIAIFA